MHALLYFLVEQWWTSPGALAVVLGLDGLSLLTVPSVLLRRRGRPLAAVAWVFALFTLPGLGLLAWWIIGRTRIELERDDSGRSHRRDEAAPAPADAEAMEALREVVPERWITQEASLRGVTAGNRVRFIERGPDFFDELLEAIAAAEHTIHVLFYIWEDDETGRRLRDALCARAQDGLTVRVLADGIGAGSWERGFARSFREAGVQAWRFLPPGPIRIPTINFRNHRKIVVIDDELAYTGGRNAAREYEVAWADAMVRIEGPAVAGLNEIFLDDWCVASGENRDELPEPRPCPARAPDGRETVEGVHCAVISSGPTERTLHLHDIFFLAITRARQRVWATTPYFVPTGAILEAMRAAALRGVDVRLITPRKTDVKTIRQASYAYFAPILSAGARVFEFEPAMHHAKTIVVDDDLSIVGTANLDQRTFRLNFELACVFSSAELNARLAERFLRDVDDSAEVALERVECSPWYEQLLESAAHLVSPIL